VWLIVDGAYGAFAALTDRGREALAGLELAGSVTLDPHKWLYQPFECGALLVRRGHLLKDAFEIHPSYLQDTTARDGATNSSSMIGITPVRFFSTSVTRSPSTRSSSRSATLMRGVAVSMPRIFKRRTE
jgi:glutamate/tyrosine decarboxylase-like PLP-dependent enzyme